MPAGRQPPAPAWLNSDDHFAYVYGYPDGRVGPLNITRAEVAAIFYRLLRKRYPHGEPNDGKLLR